MRNVILFFVCLISKKVIAEDIELYVNHNINISEKPRVLVVFDTSGSMGTVTNTGQTRMRVGQIAMNDLIDTNPDIDWGIMRFSGNGGYVLAGIGSEHSDIKRKVISLSPTGGTPLTETLWEAYLYLKGGAVTKHHGRDLSVERHDNFISPFSLVSEGNARCDNSINIIVMSDGDPNRNGVADGKVRTLYQRQFGAYPPIFNSSYMPALAKAMHIDASTDVDFYPPTSQNLDTVRVHTIGFAGMSANGKNIMKKTAELGGGQYLYANNASELSEAFTSITNNIRLDIDSFSLPVVANTGSQTTSSDSLYYTMFLPSTNTRWKGNIKKLKVKNDATLVDMSGNNAINSDGKIDENATTFWSKPDSNDGNSVDEGGINYVLSEQNTRKIYSDFGSAELHNFDYSTALAQYGNDINRLVEAMGAPPSYEIERIMLWARGIDVDDEDNDNTRYDRRKTILGDPLHSKIVSINYGTEENPDIRLLVGTNAGFMHMFKDEDTTMKESWAFIPGRLLPILKDQRNKKADTKLYGVDGQSTIYHDDKDGDNLVSSGDNVWLFFGLRRGGKQYYALDITNPDLPKLMWGGPIKGGSGDFRMLGQTWAKPLVTFIEKEGNDPVVIFPAGYDTNKDNLLKSEDAIGQGIYIVKAKTGELVWSLTRRNGFKGKHSIAANVTTLDSNYDGYDDRIYMADTGGGVWRIDMPGSDPNIRGKEWTHFKLAQLAGSSASDDRRFYNAPIIASTYFNKVTTTRTGVNTVKTLEKTPYDAVLLGSGNRTRPISSSSAVDYLFMIRDEHTVTKSFKNDDIPDPIEISNLFDVSDDPFAKKFTDFDAFTDLEVELGGFEGWKYRLNTSEKSFAEASVAGGVAYFTSFSPPGSSSNCEMRAGSGKLYAFHLHYGTKVFRKVSFDTKAAFVEAPKPYFTCKNAGSTNTNSCKTIIKLIVPPVKTDSNSPVGEEKSVWIAPEIPSKPVLENGYLKRPDTDSGVTFGLETKQLYIFKKEENDEK
jgi:type IV pilus assembly protein PilY1